MNIFKNKLAAAILSGVIIAGSSVAMLAPIADAASRDTGCPRVQADCGKYDGRHRGDRHQRHEFDTLKVADRMAECFGVKRVDVVEYLNNNGDIRTLHHACMMAKVSGHELSEVLGVCEGRTWQEAEAAMGISREAMEAEWRSLRENRDNRRQNNGDCWNGECPRPQGERGHRGGHYRHGGC